MTRPNCCCYRYLITFHCIHSGVQHKRFFCTTGWSCCYTEWLFSLGGVYNIFGTTLLASGCLQKWCACVLVVPLSPHCQGLLNTPISICHVFFYLSGESVWQLVSELLIGYRQVAASGVGGVNSSVLSYVHTRGRYRYTPVAPCLIVNHLSVTLMNWATVWSKMKFWGLTALVAISFILAFGYL